MRVCSNTYVTVRLIGEDFVCVSLSSVYVRLPVYYVSCLALILLPFFPLLMDMLHKKTSVHFVNFVIFFLQPNNLKHCIKKVKYFNTYFSKHYQILLADVKNELFSIPIFVHSDVCVCACCMSRLHNNAFLDTPIILWPNNENTSMMHLTWR